MRCRLRSGRAGLTCVVDRLSKIETAAAGDPDKIGARVLLFKLTQATLASPMADVEIIETHCVTTTQFS